MEVIRWESRPRLRSPALVVAFSGMSDAGDAATGAISFLANQWKSKPVASLDPEEFYDFSTTPPTTRRVDGVARELEWPGVQIEVATPPSGITDVVLMTGNEPQLRWRSFCEAVVEMALDLDVEMVIMLGSVMAEVPHTRPNPVTVCGNNPGFVQSTMLPESQYSGPTGVFGALNEALDKEEIPAISMFVRVPHYIALNGSPKAALTLVRRTLDVLGTTATTTELEIATVNYELQVNELVEADVDIASYVRSLEEALDRHSLGVDDGAKLAAEVERYQREQAD